MAISLIAKPDSFSPAYNPLKYIYDSTNKNETGFKYVFDIYDTASTDKIAEYRVFPNLDGYGEVDLSRLLQSYVSYDFDPTQDGTFKASNSYFQYSVKIGEEFVDEVSYTASLTQNGSYTKITATHAYAVGDQVVVTQTSPGAANPTLDGLHTVTAVTGTTDFTINVLWSEITDATTNGVVNFADNRKTITRDIVTVSGAYVFNGALPFEDWNTYVSTDYILTANTDKFLTSMPLEFSATPEQELWINFLTNGVATGYAYFQNDQGDIFRKGINTASSRIEMVGCGPGNTGTLVTVFGSGNLVESDTLYYDFWYTNSAFTQHSVKYRINIDTRCKINEWHVLFLDRMGSLGSFAFQLRDKFTGVVTNEKYNQDITGVVTSNVWAYKSFEQGMRTINPRIEETLEMNTNWMTEDEARYFSELVSSPQTWLFDGTNYYACTIEDKSYEIERQRNKNLIRKTVKIIRSVQDRVNG